MQLSGAIARNYGESCHSGKNMNNLAASLFSRYSAALARYFFFGLSTLQHTNVLANRSTPRHGCLSA
jgi:hypothetical protein